MALRFVLLPDAHRHRLAEQFLQRQAVIVGERFDPEVEHPPERFLAVEPVELQVVAVQAVECEHAGHVAPSSSNR